MNWPVLIVVGIAAIALIAFLIWKNQKDEKVFEDELKNDIGETRNENHDTDLDEEVTQ